MKLYYLYSREDAERDADEDEAEHEHVVQDFQPATQMWLFSIIYILHIY